MEGSIMKAADIRAEGQQKDLGEERRRNEGKMTEGHGEGRMRTGREGGQEMGKKLHSQFTSVSYINILTCLYAIP